MKDALAYCKCCRVVHWVPLDQLNQRATFTPEAFEYLCPVCQRTTFFALLECGAPALSEAEGSAPLSGGTR